MISSHNFFRASICLDLEFLGKNRFFGCVHVWPQVPKQPKIQFLSRHRFAAPPKPIYFINLHTHAHMHSDFWDDWLCFGRVAVSNIFTVVNALFGRDPKAKIGKNAPGTVSKNAILRKKKMVGSFKCTISHAHSNFGVRMSRTTKVSF